MLELNDITRTYRHSTSPVRALDHLSLAVDAGQFLAVCGPSGCGKTTLLLIAGGLLAPTSGQVVINGQNVYALNPDARAAFRADHIGFVFQQFHLVSYLTVRENILAASLASSTTAAPVPPARYADELIERFGLADRVAHRPAELSTGERQRTALARALLHRPRLLLADEPTGNLDPDNAAVVLDHLADFADQGGAVLLVTHDADAARRADRTVHLQAGRLVEPVQTAEPV